MPRMRLRGLFLALFAVYAALLVYLLFFAGWYDHSAGIRRTSHYNLVPFREIRRFWKARKTLPAMSVFLNLYGNILGFVPLGFFLPVAVPLLRRVWLAVPASALVSLTVESVQLVTMIGNFDVDDIILNTFGAFLGYLGFCLYRIRVIREAGRKKRRNRNLY